MKAAVMKLEGNKAVVMCDDGTVKRIDNDNYSVGEELEITEKTTDKYDKLLGFTRKNMPVAAAAAAFVVCLSGGLFVANVKTASVVTLDINPSLKYSLNMFEKVIDVDSFNDDGEEIVVQIKDDAKGKNIENAVKLTLDELDRTGYVKEETAVVVTLDSRTHSEDSLETQVIGSVGKWNNEKSDEGELKSVAVETVRVTPEMAGSAEDKNVSPGKIYIVGKLKEQVLESAEFNEDEWLDKSVMEIEEAANSVSTAMAAKKVSENKAKVSENLLTAEVQKPKTEEKTEEPGNSGEKKAKAEEKANTGKSTEGSKKKSKSSSANSVVSANIAEGALIAAGLGGGTSLSADAVTTVSGEQIIVSTPEIITDPALVVPTISSQPEEPAVPEVTEPVVTDSLETLTTDQSYTDSSYLDVQMTQDVTCDSILVENQM